MAVRESSYGGKTRWQHVHNGRGEFQEDRADRAGWLRSSIDQGAYCQRCGTWRGALGLEPTPEQYVANLSEVFDAVGRVLSADGTLWLNLGDCYASKARGSDAGWDKSRLTNPGSAQKAQAASLRSTGERHRGKSSGLKSKDLVGVPWMAAFALRSAGWWLRRDIIWSKPNPMPESVQDRPTSAHEYLFLLAKSERYFYDQEAVREPYIYGRDHPRNLDNPPESHVPGTPKHTGLRRSGNTERKYDDAVGRPESHLGRGIPWQEDGRGRNRCSVWEIATQPFPDAHFATFPPKLVEPCVLAGSKPGDTVLDPFAGAGTTGLVATRLDRDFIGIELNPEYAEMARNRIRDDAPLLNVGAEAA